MKKSLLKVGLAMVAGLGLTVSAFQFGSGEAQARPNYNKAFQAKYPGLKALYDEAKCNVCHAGMSKKMRNEYGMAFGGALGAKEVKDAAAVDAALTKAEGEKSTSGKTFGELIKEGKLPAG